MLTPSKASKHCVLSATDLEELLREAHRIIEQKDKGKESSILLFNLLINCKSNCCKDLILAAEIGQSLLESNQQLKDEYERVLSEYSQNIESEQLNGSRNTRANPSSMVATASALKDLECLHLDLQARFDALQAEHKLLQESERNIASNYDREQVHKQQIIKEHQSVAEQLESALLDKKRLAREKSELIERIKAADKAHSGGESQLSKALERLHATESKLDQLAMQYEAVVDENTTMKSEAADAMARLDELQSLLETYQGYRDESEERGQTIEHLSMELEAAHDQCEKLKLRLAVLEPSSDDTDVAIGGKTLLSEVEDKRQELVEQHSNLSKQHSSLVKVHSMSLYQQERMKMHISRLSQLAQNNSAEQRIQMLEQALSQVESEKSNLEARLIKLERMLASKHRDEDDEDFNSDGQNSEPRPQHSSTVVSNDLMTATRLRLEQAENEVFLLRRELQTLRLVKGAESEKVMKLQGQVSKQMLELEQLRTVCAQLRFQLEEKQLDSTHDTVSVVDDTVSVVDETAPVVDATVSVVDDGTTVSNHISTAQETTIKIPKVDDEQSVQQKAIETMRPENVSLATTETGAKTSRIDRSKIQKEECVQQ